MESKETAIGNDLAKRIEELFDRLWPVNRTLAGPGFNESLDIIAGMMPVERLLFPTGSKVFDWTVPPEWRPREAHFTGPDGVRRAEFSKNNLHLLGYSVPFKGTITLGELKEHLYVHDELPDAIPYRTSYYKERWGFCISKNEYDALPEGDYEVVIDTEITPGNLVVGEAVLPGETDRDIVLSSYLCHPSMANNELSGPLILAFAYEELARRGGLRHNVRFVLGPETIGALCYLSMRADRFREKLDAAYVLTMIDAGDSLHYKKSARGNTIGDRAVEISGVVAQENITGFSPIGSDERQYCSPGFDLPCGMLTQHPQAGYYGYHSSEDNKSIIDFERMAGTVADVIKIVETADRNLVDGNVTYRNLFPYGEPQLGPRGLYRDLGIPGFTDKHEESMFWILNRSNGERDLLSISEQSGIAMKIIMEMAARLHEAGLLELVE